MRVLRWFERAAAVYVLLTLVLLVTPITDWILNTMDRQDPLSHARYIICLGGHPSRVIEAARLLQEGYADQLIVSNFADAAVMMRDLAIEWGVPAESILVDDRSSKTLDHPIKVRKLAGLDPAKDACILVTSYTHLARSKACFEKAGYRHLIMREPRWERAFRMRFPPGWRSRFLLLPKLIYEGAAWVEYSLRGAI